MPKIPLPSLTCRDTHEPLSGIWRAGEKSRRQRDPGRWWHRCGASSHRPSCWLPPPSGSCPVPLPHLEGNNKRSEVSPGGHGAGEGGSGCFSRMWFLQRQTSFIMTHWAERQCRSPRWTVPVKSHECRRCSQTVFSEGRAGRECDSTSVLMSLQKWKPGGKKKWLLTFMNVNGDAFLPPSKVKVHVPSLVRSKFVARATSADYLHGHLPSFQP